MDVRAEPAAEPLVVAPVMGYGHMRAATSLADTLGAHVSRSDVPPLATPHEVVTWNRIRRFYEQLSRLSQHRGAGAPALSFLEWLTAIPPLHPERSLSRPTRSAHTLERLLAQGFLRTLSRHVLEDDVPLVSTFYAEAIAADRMRHERVYCVVTDSDINRVWAPMRGERSRIHYFVPTQRAARRLQAFGVREANTEVTGFPLPPELVGEDAGILRRHLARRLVRLDPRGVFRSGLERKTLDAPQPGPGDDVDGAPLLVFAVGGAGAQAELVPAFLPGLHDAIAGGRLRLALVAGVRPEVARHMLKWVRREELEEELGRGIRILWRRDFPSYYRAFNDLLAEADVLWTKPGELVFYAALGLPLLLSPPVGVQERGNARWVLDRGGAIAQGEPKHAGSWLKEMVESGLLAGAAWSGYARLPHAGSYRIRERLRG